MPKSKKIIIQVGTGGYWECGGCGIKIYSKNEERKLLKMKTRLHKKVCKNPIKEDTLRSITELDMNKGHGFNIKINKNGLIM